jgi:hypothetical protein
MNMVTNVLDVVAKYEESRNWFMPRIEPSSCYCIKDQTSKNSFISTKEPLLNSLKIKILLFGDLLKLVLEQNMLQYKIRITVNMNLFKH